MKVTVFIDSKKRPNKCEIQPQAKSEFKILEKFYQFLQNNKSTIDGFEKDGEFIVIFTKEK
jgi:hypothetical protein